MFSIRQNNGNRVSRYELPCHSKRSLERRRHCYSRALHPRTRFIAVKVQKYSGHVSKREN
jgi:hypothetical protein